MISLKELKEAEYKGKTKIVLSDNSVFVGEAKEWQQPEEEDEEYTLTIQVKNNFIELKQSEIKSIEIIEDTK